MVLIPSTTFLDYFKESDESFLIHRGMIYTLHSPQGQDSENYLYYARKKYAILESEDIDTLKKEYVNSNRGLIERLITGYVKEKYINKISTLKDEIKNKKNIFEHWRNTSTEKFIIKDVFEEYCRLYNLDSSTNKNNNEIIDFNVNDYANLKSPEIYIEDFEDTELNQIFNDNSLLIIGQRAYQLRKVNGSCDNFVKLNNIRYKILNSETLDQLISRYNSAISNSIMYIADKNSQSYIETLNEYEKARKDIDNLISKEKNYSLINESQRRSERTKSTIGFKAKGRQNNQLIYEVYLELEPYIIKKSNDYYLFEKVRLGNSLAVLNTKIKIIGKPSVLTQSYHHPFVHDNLEICYNDQPDKPDRFEREGVNFGFFNIDRLEYDGFARNVAVALNISRKAMEYGYNADEVIAVHSLSLTNFPNEYLKGGRNEALSRGIRIIDNDERFS